MEPLTLGEICELAKVPKHQLTSNGVVYFDIFKRNLSLL